MTEAQPSHSLERTANVDTNTSFATQKGPHLRFKPGGYFLCPRKTENSQVMQEAITESMPARSNGQHRRKGGNSCVRTRAERGGTPSHLASLRAEEQKVPLLQRVTQLNTKGEDLAKRSSLGKLCQCYHRHLCFLFSKTGDSSHTFFGRHL